MTAGASATGARSAAGMLPRVVLAGALSGAAVLGGVELGRIAQGSGHPMLGGIAVVGLGGAALLAYALRQDASLGIMVWLAAALVSLVYPGPGVLSPDRLAFVVLVAAWLIEVRSGRRRIGPVGLIEGLMLAYLVVNVASAIAPHVLPAVSGDVPPSYSQPISMIQAVQQAAFYPLVIFALARQLLTDPARVTRFLWFLTAVGIYLGLTNIFTDLGPQSLVFPRDILDQSVGLVTPGQGRARGIFLNGAPTGTAIVLSFVAAVHLATTPRMRGRWIAVASLPVMLVGLYFTHTRAPLASGLLVLVLLALTWRGWRAWFAAALAVIAVIAIANLGNLTSSDRTRGGVGSTLEAQDRLNIAATAWWAVQQEPLTGWGLGRYEILNTWHHRQWGTTDWIRGYGDAAHDTEMGIVAELGLAGLAVWLAILVAVGAGTLAAFRALPAGDGFGSRRIVVGFWCAAAAFLVNGSFIDMRFYPYIMGLVFAWAGMVIGMGDRARAPAAGALAHPPSTAPAALGA